MPESDEVRIFMAFSLNMRNAEFGLSPHMPAGEIIDQDGHILSPEPPDDFGQHDPASSKALMDFAWAAMALFQTLKAQAGDSAQQGFGAERPQDGDEGRARASGGFHRFY
jgi:hypothetical protein